MRYKCAVQCVCNCVDILYVNVIFVLFVLLLLKLRQLMIAIMMVAG